MSSTDHDTANTLVVSQPESGGRQLKGGIIVATYVLAVVVAMAG
jgi:hypothetical protein